MAAVIQAEFLGDVSCRAVVVRAVGVVVRIDPRVGSRTPAVTLGSHNLEMPSDQTLDFSGKYTCYKRLKRITTGPDYLIIQTGDLGSAMFSNVKRIHPMP